jgi:hypothetical protein
VERSETHQQLFGTIIPERLLEMIFFPFQAGSALQGKHQPFPRAFRLMRPFEQRIRHTRIMGVSGVAPYAPFGERGSFVPMGNPTFFKGGQGDFSPKLTVRQSDV